MEIKNKPRDSRFVFLVSAILLISGIMVSIFVWEKSSRDEDMKYLDNLKVKDGQNKSIVPVSPKNGQAKNDGQQTLTNPAAANCADKGGTSIIKENPLGQYGVCVFDHNRQCEEWAMMREECPVGGLEILGYATDAAQFCIISGGEYAIVFNKSKAVQQGTCAFKNGKKCDVWEFWNGKCSKDIKS
jgi:putative hemolysin